MTVSGTCGREQSPFVNEITNNRSIYLYSEFFFWDRWAQRIDQKRLNASGWHWTPVNSYISSFIKYHGDFRRFLEPRECTVVCRDRQVSRTREQFFKKWHEGHQAVTHDDFDDSLEDVYYAHLSPADQSFCAPQRCCRQVHFVNRKQIAPSSFSDLSFWKIWPEFEWWFNFLSNYPFFSGKNVKDKTKNV